MRERGERERERERPGPHLRQGHVEHPRDQPGRRYQGREEQLMAANDQGARRVYHSSLARYWAVRASRTSAVL